MRIIFRYAFIAPQLAKFARTVTMLQSQELPYKSLVETIFKSPQDSRSYRGLVLQNDLKVLLISDPSTEKAAAAFDVNIGCMKDPWKLQGLAHFLEHMLFMGTEKYPEENAFEKYVSEHGGQYNAYTCEEHTNYHFDVAADYLEPSLDRFAQFFIAPLLTDSSTEREVNAVNSEHENNLTSDSRRLDHLSRVTGDPEHDFNKFGTGNKDTLWFNPAKEGIAVRDELLAFHRAYYSSNISSLVVVGKESLDWLSELVCKMFSEVPNKNVQVPKWDHPPFKPEHLKVQLKVVPVKDVRSLNVVWPIPDLHSYYKTKPGHYLGGLIGHEGPGSLLSALKAKGWSNTLHAGEDDGANGFQFFMVGVDLTEEGLAHTDDIILMIYQYLDMLRKTGPQEWIWQEEQQIQEIKFRFRDKEKPISCARGLAAVLQKYPLSEVLSGPALMKEYNPVIIKDLLTWLTPDSMRISILSQRFKGVVTEKEPIYGVEYCVDAIPEKNIAVWKDVVRNEGLVLPAPNEFIPQHFEILPPSEAIHRLPVLIRKTEYSRLWYLQDVEHKLPKGVAFFEICSSAVYKDALYANATYLFVELFKDAVNEMIYSADLAGMKYVIEQSKYGLTPSLQLSVRGYDDKLDVLLKMLVDKLVSFKPDVKRFEVLKEVYGRQLKNFFATEPNRQSMWYFNVLMSEICFTKESLIAALEEISYEKLMKMVSEIFSQVYLEGFVYGNVSRKKAEDMLDIMESAMRSINAASLSNEERLRLVQLPDGRELVYHQTNSVHKSSSVTNYYQCSFEDRRQNMLLELYEQIISEPCFDILRTKEQLGYIVYSSIKNVSGVLGLQILVQSNRTPDHVDARIEHFLGEMNSFIKALSEEEFQTHIEALAVRRLEKPKTIMQQASKFWNEMYVRQYNFDRDNEEVRELRTIEKLDLLKFIKDYLLSGGCKRKKLSIHITSTVSKVNKPESNQSRKRRADPNGEFKESSAESIEDSMELSQESQPAPPVDVPKMTAQVIEDIEKFKKEMGFYPHAPKYMDIDKLHSY